MNIFSNDPRIGIPEALLKLRPGTQWTLYGDTYDKLAWHENDSEPPTKEEVEEQIRLLKEEWINNEYQRKRANDYPSVEDQLDILYHLGYNGWKSEITKIKDKYPKSK